VPGLNWFFKKDGGLKLRQGSLIRMMPFTLKGPRVHNFDGAQPDNRLLSHCKIKVCLYEIGISMTIFKKRKGIRLNSRKEHRIMSYRKTVGLLALVLVTAFVTALAATAHAVSYSSPGAGSSIEAPAFYPPSNSQSYPETTPGASSLNLSNAGPGQGDYGSQPYASPYNAPGAQGDFGSQSGYGAPSDMSTQSGSYCQ
jgi:hypothetical protein